MLTIGWAFLSFVDTVSQPVLSPSFIDRLVSIQLDQLHSKLTHYYSHHYFMTIGHWWISLIKGQYEDLLCVLCCWLGLDTLWTNSRIASDLRHIYDRVTSLSWWRAYSMGSLSHKICTWFCCTLFNTGTCYLSLRLFMMELPVFMDHYSYGFNERRRYILAHTQNDPDTFPGCYIITMEIYDWSVSFSSPPICWITWRSSLSSIGFCYNDSFAALIWNRYITSTNLPSIRLKYIQLT